MVNFTWDVSEYKVHELPQRYVLSSCRLFYYCSAAKPVASVCMARGCKNTTTGAQIWPVTSHNIFDAPGALSVTLSVFGQMKVRKKRRKMMMTKMRMKRRTRMRMMRKKVTVSWELHRKVILMVKICPPVPSAWTNCAVRTLGRLSHVITSSAWSASWSGHG